ncbi:DUF2946 family protein [Herbaspirillum robiniae]|uniref:DUF2946 family protein n=1 Tax=Herbaspirillum robiniae TaxID=2014887 RepID=UPI003D78AE98
MPTRQPASYRLAARRLTPRVLLCLALTLAMVAAPWWQQAFARGAAETSPMAICSVGSATGAGGAPLHAASGHCQLCCGNPSSPALPPAELTGATGGISYPLPPQAAAGRSSTPAPGSPQARGPPSARYA